MLQVPHESCAARPPRTTRGLVVISVLVLSMTSWSAGGVFEVGSFVKSTGAAPVSQNVTHGLGVTPKCVILWTSAVTNESWINDALFGFGASDGTNEYSVSAASEDGVGTSNSSRRIADKALTVVAWGQNLVAEADLTGWNSSRFTLNWTTNNATAWVIHYIAIGGDDISASVVNWTIPTSNGDRAVTGVGFEPTAVLHCWEGSTTGTIPSSLTSLGFGLGVMEPTGDQWSSYVTSRDAQADGTSYRIQETNTCLQILSAAGTVLIEGAYSSMDSDGFTVNFGTTDGFSGQVLSIALDGVDVHAGSFDKTTSAAPVSQRITGVPFEPELLLLVSDQNTASTSSQNDAYFGFGATDGTTDGCSALTDRDGRDPTSVDQVDKTSSVFLVADNDSQTTDAEADLSAFELDGFTLDWTTNDSNATQILYLAMTPFAALEVELESARARQTDRGVRLVWRTRSERSNLGFHVTREGPLGRERLTVAPITGSALIAPGPSSVLQASDYSWVDSQGTEDSVYWLESIALDGTRELHGPLAVERTASSTPTPAPPPVSPTAWEAPRRNPTSAPNRGFGRQLAIAAAGAIEIGVSTEGWYRVTGADLVSSGLAPTVDPRRLRLYTDGVEQSVVVEGESDGVLDPQDTLEFYGIGPVSQWSDTRSYWLLVGDRPGNRIELERREPDFPASDSYTNERQLRERVVYFAGLVNGDRSNLFGRLISQQPELYSISLPGWAQASPDPVTFELTLQGVTNSAHTVSVFLNGTPIGELSLPGRSNQSWSVPVPPSLVQISGNELTLITGSPGDFVMVDTLSVRYPRLYFTGNEILTCSVPRERSANLHGFPDTLRAFDVTDSHRPIELATRKSPVGTGLVVNGRRDRERAVLAVPAGAALEPTFVCADQPSTWHATYPGADFLILAPAALVDEISPLADRRASEGWTPIVVPIESVYDEFGFGSTSPHAIREFLRYGSENWSLRPTAVLLVGDSTYDPLGLISPAPPHYVPTKLVDTADLEVSSDDWFGDFDEDGLSELSVGRLPVTDAGDCARVVSKLLAYPQSTPWQSRVLLVADDADRFDYMASLARLGPILPDGLTVDSLSIDPTNPISSRDQLAAELQAGVGLMAYFGHGGLTQWAAEGLLSNASVGQLSNDQRRPIVLGFCCLSGFFHHPTTKSLAETLITTPQGGAIAVWAPSGAIGPARQQALAQSFAQVLAIGDARSLGEALREAKARTSGRDVRTTWNLLGDPTLPIRFLTNRQRP